MNHVDIKNLLGSDVVLERPKIIKKAIKDAVREVPELGVIPEKLSFSPFSNSTTDFPGDSVVIETVLLTDPSLSNMRCEQLKANLAVRICKKVKRVLEDFRGGNKNLPEVKVGVKSFDRFVDGYYAE